MNVDLGDQDGQALHQCPLGQLEPLEEHLLAVWCPEHGSPMMQPLPSHASSTLNALASRTLGMLVTIREAVVSRRVVRLPVDQSHQGFGVLYPAGVADPLSALEIVLATLQGEANLRHVRAWWSVTGPTTAREVGHDQRRHGHRRRGSPRRAARPLDGQQAICGLKR